MNLTEYDTICAQMGAYCERAYRQENIDGEICPKVSACDVQTLEGYELELMKGYNKQFRELKESIEDLQGNPARLQKMERYRQDFAVYGTIQTLIDDIKADKVYCPQKAQKRLIGSLERLYQMFFSISQMCFAEFDKIKPRKKKLKEKSPLTKKDIVSNPEALEYCYSVKEHLDDNFRIKRGTIDKAKMVDIAYKLKAILHRPLKEIAEFWGVECRAITNSNYYKRHK